MLFRRIVLCALLVGALSGLLVSAVQHWQVIPIIAAAEVFEGSAESAEEAAPLAATAHDHDHAEGAAHAHEEAAWEPEDGTERHVWTVIANVMTAIGFSLVLIAAITTWEHLRGRRVASARTGLVWGAAGWLCVFAAPSLGLPPEIPGTAAAALEARQAWWLLAVACSATGLGLLAFVPGRLRWLGIAVLALPYAIGAPHIDGAFAAYSDEVARQMEALTARFAIATSISSAIEWLALGSLAGGAVARWVRPALATLGSPATARA
jgi:cobalt transporter subunit CbtA